MAEVLSFVASIPYFTLGMLCICDIRSIGCRQERAPRRGAWGGPPRGPGRGRPHRHGPPPPPWGPGRGEGWKPQKTIQSPDRLYKDIKDYTKPQNTRQNPKTLDNDSKYLTRLATTINSTYNIKYPRKTTCTHEKGITIHNRALNWVV